MSEALFINDIFWTFQGEGANWGRRALFVRMPYCNLACSWCDTTFNSYNRWQIDDFKNFAKQEPARFAVITGGEPMMHRHTPRVVKLLSELHFTIACETNGTFPIVDGIDFVTCSPKKDAEYYVHPDAYHKVKEFKYVVDKDFDFSILERHKQDEVHVKHRLSPEFNNLQENVKAIENYLISSSVRHPEWCLNLQTHKWIGVP